MSGKLVCFSVFIYDIILVYLFSPRIKIVDRPIVAGKYLKYKRTIAADFEVQTLVHH